MDSVPFAVLCLLLNASVVEMEAKGGREKKERERERKGSWDSAGKFLHCLRAAGQWGWCECSHLGAFLVGFFRLKMCFPGCVFCWRANAILCLFLLGFLVELPERLLSV